MARERRRKRSDARVLRHIKSCWTMVLHNSPRQGCIVAHQVGPDEVRSNALVEALAQLARRAAFNQLRTLEQLGYIVFLSAWSDELVRSLVRASLPWCMTPHHA